MANENQNVHLNESVNKPTYKSTSTVGNNTNNTDSKSKDKE